MNPVAVLDFGAEHARILIAEKETDQSVRILGAGESAAMGVEHGRIIHLGDAVESIHEALRKAERSAKLRVKKLYYNFNDLNIQSLRAKGARVLKGEGEIKEADVRLACETAKRLIERFDLEVVYAKELYFIIDDKDRVILPKGIFGRKLDVCLHVLQADTENCQKWVRAMERCSLEGVPVLSAWSTAYGVLPKEDRLRCRLIVDLGLQTTTLFVYENNTIRHFRVWAKDESGSEAPHQLKKVCQEILETDKAIEQILFTGDLAESSQEVRDFESIGRPCVLAAALGAAKLAASRYASLVGLVHVASELESQAVHLYPKKGMTKHVREKAVSFVKEYF